jgi:hypothetical protein
MRFSFLNTQVDRPFYYYYYRDHHAITINLHFIHFSFHRGKTLIISYIYIRYIGEGTLAGIFAALKNIKNRF